MGNMKEKDFLGELEVDGIVTIKWLFQMWGSTV